MNRMCSQGSALARRPAQKLPRALGLATKS